MINYSGNEAPASALVDKIGTAGGQAIAVKADVSRPSEVGALFDETSRAFGGVDAIVNNAGIMKLSPLAQTEDDLFDRHVAINLKGVFNCLREGARRIREGGRIVSFSSSVVGLYQPTYGAYAATKAGVEAMTHILAKELGPKKITVNAVAPGPVATKLFLDDKTEEQIATVAKMIPLGRLAEPQDIAAAVAMLLGPDSHWITGQVIRANGGAI
ncbi:3-oxoacyl-[acyl-carrier protein] reductase [Aureimonas jatrophae]|uniref:3-oxoacyl-[acyl-carrier protein] reductase n=2 Tax=Aureimonas jatrophae TaxID=1166073 RepID=A0A1H0FQM2_9HYPH|nr:3-oxoacyl-[acyl-carrier protein] reductase [Aureimonas jatrophae]SDN96945.1 3-oxoacyl-[acyl-carrier protein] reductase [Aureimonas jatrophae]